MGQELKYFQTWSKEDIWINPSHVDWIAKTPEGLLWINVNSRSFKVSDTEENRVKLGITND